MTCQNMSVYLMGKENSYLYSVPSSLFPLITYVLDSLFFSSVILYIIFSYSSFNYITYNYYVIRKKNILINYTLFLDTGYCNNDYFVNLLKQIILI